MRIVSFNCAGLSRYDVPQLVAELGSPDVLCLQEVRLTDPRSRTTTEPRPRTTTEPQSRTTTEPRPRTTTEPRPRTTTEPRPIGSGPLDHGPLAFARGSVESAIPHVSGYVGGASLHPSKKLYGVVTYARDAVFATTPWDREGRLLFARVGELIVLNVYAVNGTKSPYLDPELGRYRGTRNDFKREFIRRLADDLAPVKDRLIAIGDWNVSRAKIDTHPRLRTEEPHATARREFNEEFIAGLDLVDVFRELHPDARKYTWFNTRSRTLDAARVDFALISRSLMPRVLAADIDDDRHRSDHAPLFVELE